MNSAPQMLFEGGARCLACRATAAAQHSVQPTWGTRRVILAFSWLGVFPVSAASPRSHPKRLTQTVRRAIILVTKEKEMGYKRVVITEFGEQKYSR